MSRTPSKRLHAILTAVASVLVPRHESFPAIEEDVAAFVGRFMTHFPFYLRVPMVLGLYAIQYAPPLTLFSPRTFTGMTAERRERLILSWAQSRYAFKRDLIRGLQAVCMIGAYSRPEVISHLGYTIEDHIRSRG